MAFPAMLSNSATEASSAAEASLSAIFLAFFAIASRRVSQFLYAVQTPSNSLILIFPSFGSFAKT